MDDEPENLSALKRTLRRAGYRLFTADGVESAISVLHRERIDVRVTDYRMPVRKGDKLLEHALEHYPEIARILLTGYSSTDKAESFIDSGLAHHLIRKPWNNRVLCELIAGRLKELPGSYRH